MSFFFRDTRELTEDIPTVPQDMCEMLLDHVKQMDLQLMEFTRRKEELIKRCDALLKEGIEREEKLRQMIEESATMTVKSFDDRQLFGTANMVEGHAGDNAQVENEEESGGLEEKLKLKNILLVPFEETKKNHQATISEFQDQSSLMALEGDQEAIRLEKTEKLPEIVEMELAFYRDGAIYWGTQL